jgi:hypothetical protein
LYKYKPEAQAVQPAVDEQLEQFVVQLLHTPLFAYDPDGHELTQVLLVDNT